MAARTLREEENIIRSLRFCANDVELDRFRKGSWLTHGESVVRLAGHRDEVPESGVIARERGGSTRSEPWIRSVPFATSTMTW